jgi:hypothetical protein
MYQPTVGKFSHNILTIAVAQLPPPKTATFNGVFMNVRFLFVLPKIAINLQQTNLFQFIPKCCSKNDWQDACGESALSSLFYMQNCYLWKHLKQAS